MIEVDLKKLTAPDFTASIRPGMPALMVIDEAAIPSIYWEPREPRLNRQELVAELKQGGEITGVTLSNPEPSLEREDTVMAFSAKQVQALRRQPHHRHIRTRQANGRELTYLEGWYAISEANRIFGFDGWSRETIESRCALTRENRGTFLAVYTAKVRITVRAAGTTIVREGHGSGEGRGTSPGEVHDIALKAAETDATKRALATFGKPFGLELYRGGKTAVPQKALPSPSTAPVVEPARSDGRVGFHPDDTTPIPRPSRYYGRRQNVLAEHFRAERRQAERAAPVAPPLAPPAHDPSPGRIDKSLLALPEPKRLRDKAHLKFVASQALPDLRAAAVRPASCALCPAARDRDEGERRVHRPPLPRPSPAAASGRQ